jgi:hypothetical protein
LAACTDRGPSADASGSGSGEASADDGTSDEGTSASTTSASTTSASTTGDGDESTTGAAGCDPSDPEIGPAVSVAIENQTDAPIYVTEATGCGFVPPFAILRDEAALQWVLEPCVSCSAVISGQCGCPGACFQDSVIRIDPGGRWDGEWTGAEAHAVELAAECVGEFCGPACTALLQAPDGDYVARAVASTAVDCGVDMCDCNDALDPAGFCSVSGVRSGTETTRDVPFVYADTTSIEIVFAP